MGILTNIQMGQRTGKLYVLLHINLINDKLLFLFVIIIN